MANPNTKTECMERNYHHQVDDLRAISAEQNYYYEKDPHQHNKLNTNENIAKIGNNDNFKIVLVDFNCNNIVMDEIFDKLIIKMRSRKDVGFSNLFEHAHTLIDLGELVKTGHGPYNWPYGVAISKKCNCIFISDQYSNNINIFDLESKKLKAKFTTFFDPGCLCVESDNLDDSLIVSSCKDRAVYKWNNLKSVVMKSINKERMPLYAWKQDKFGTPRGLVVRYDKQSSFNTLFVCDNGKHNITLLNSESGQILRTISKLDGIYLGEPFGIDLNNYGDLIVSEKHFNRVQIIYLDTSSGEWITKIKFGSKDGSLKCPSGLIFDRVKEQIIVCDQENQRIAIYKENGDLIQTFGSFGTCKSNKNPHLLNYPTTICLYEKTGELFVVDSWNIRVLVFK